MKVLQVLLSLSAGGAEGFITNLSVSLAKAGVDVKVYVIVGLRGERGKVLLARLERAGVEIVGAGERKPGITFSNLEYMARLPFFIRRWRPDIVQVNNPVIELPCAFARLLSPGSGSHFIRRLPSTKLSRGFSSSVTGRFRARVFELSVACSEAVAASCRSAMAPEHAKRLTTIPNGGHLLEKIPDLNEKLQARAKTGIPRDAFVVAHVGRMTGGPGRGRHPLEKGPKAHDVLLKAFAGAFRDEDNSVLALAGDGPLRKDAARLAGTLGIESRVRFLGRQPEPWPVLKAADVFCFPSRHEGLPNVLPEAASCGLPVVASDIPEIRDLAPGEGWELVAVDDVSGFAGALKNIRDNIRKYSALAGQNAQGFRGRFSMELCAERYIKVYENLLKPDKGGIK